MKLFLVSHQFVPVCGWQEVLNRSYVLDFARN